MKYIICSIALLIVFTVGFYLYFQWDIAQFKQEIASQTEEFTIARDAPKTDTDIVTQDVTELLLESPELSAEKHIMNVILAQSDSAEDVDTNQPVTSMTDATEDVRMSPFGFGPYPEIPEGFPFEDPWTSLVHVTDREAMVFELIHRVHIKLWNEGKRPEGLSHENGVIYASYPNTVYVTWEYEENEHGTLERYPSYITSGTISDEANALLDEGIIPPDVIVYDHSDVGIDPYAYLELK